MTSTIVPSRFKYFTKPELPCIGNPNKRPEDTDGMLRHSRLAYQLLLSVFAIASLASVIPRSDEYLNPFKKCLAMPLPVNTTTDVLHCSRPLQLSLAI